MLAKLFVCNYLVTNWSEKKQLKLNEMRLLREFEFLDEMI